MKEEAGSRSPYETIDVSYGNIGDEHLPYWLRYKFTKIKLKSQSERADVFRELTEGGPVPKGYVDMTIKASIKTHKEGHYPLEPREQFHGNPNYPFLINIDDQAAIWKVDGRMDNIPQYDEKGRTSAGPEAGSGVKYVLDKKIRIASGTHRIFLGLPAENFSKEFEVTLNEGKMYVLEMKPIYQEQVHPYRMPSFLEGIKEYEVFLNGILLRYVNILSDCLSGNGRF